MRRIVLVGLMGSGKSTIGRRLARALGWAFVDVDAEIVRRNRRTIADIFATDGEPVFREMEHAATLDALEHDRVVVASGGGWPCFEGRLDALPEGTLSVWLQVSPERALSRVGRPGASRPLLDVDDPLGRMKHLAESRESYYRGAGWWIDTDRRSPSGTARLLAEKLETDSGRPLRL